MKKFKLSEGEKLSRLPNNPIIEVVPGGEQTYLWIGNDAPNDMACFALLSDPDALEKLAKEILRCLRMKNQVKPAA